MTTTPNLDGLAKRVIRSRVMDKRALQANARKILDPVVEVLVAFHVSPLLVSLFGLAFAVIVLWLDRSGVWPDDWRR